jgi:hypothetical protein
MLLLARITSTDPAPFMGKRWYRVLRQLVKGDSTMKSMIHHEDADRLTRHAARPVAARQPLIDSARALLAEGREPESSSCCIGPAAMSGSRGLLRFSARLGRREDDEQS